ncbi:MAG: sulfatase, partial [Clostridia bacterium]|nr:sulfatase [Clostridia bacterium]
GLESAEKVTPLVLDWLDRNGDSDNWFMHVHFWDPHTPYRAPGDFGNPFENEALSDNWIDREIFDEHLLHIGPHGANEINMWNDNKSEKFPRHPGKLEALKDVKSFIDQYDCGVKYTDDNIGKIIGLLKEKGLYSEDLAVIITSDHGENLGELGIYAEHGTADEPTCHIPMIIKWPNCKKGFKANGFCDNVDLLPTIRELFGFNGRNKNYQYDGVSYAKTLLQGEAMDLGKGAVILTQCCHVCQRSARFDDYIYIRTYHGGYHLFEKEMLFNIKTDPHQLHNIAAEDAELCAKGAKLILDWVDEMMKKSIYQTDPLWTVMKEGGPLHARGELNNYIKRISGTNRDYGVNKLKEMYPEEKYN